MGVVRLLIRGGILVLISIAAVVALTILFSAQIRFDQAAELQIRGPATGRGPNTIVTARHGLFAETGEAHASPSDNLLLRGQEVTREPLTKPLVYLTERIVPDPLEPRAQSAVIEAGPAPKDSRFVSVRVNRPGAEPRVFRVPKER